MKVLSKVFGQSVSLEDFFSRFYNRLPLSIAGGAQDFVDHLNWKVMEEVIEEKKSILRIVKNGQMVKDFADLHFSECVTYFENGHTLVIKNSEKSHLLLNQLAREFETFFYAPVDIQVFCTPKESMGFGWHYDVEDVFIFQTHGTKHFTLRQNTIHHQPSMLSLPKDLGFERETSNLFIDVTLKKGDWLYIPAGWWHTAKTNEDESMHISLGVLAKTALDLLPFLQKELAQNPSWRTRFPLYQKFKSPEEEVSFYQEGLDQLGQLLVNTMKDPDFIKTLLSGLREGF